MYVNMYVMCINVCKYVKKVRLRLKIGQPEQNGHRQQKQSASEARNTRGNEQ